MRAWQAVMSVVIFGCGRIGFDAHAAVLRDGGDEKPCAGEQCAVDAAGDDAAPGGGFSTDASLPAGDAGDAERDGGGSTLADAGYLPVDAAVPDGGVMAASPCPALGGAWAVTTPEAVDVLNTSRYEGGVSLSPDGLTLTFSSTRAGGQRDMFRSQRATTSAPWSTPVAESSAINTTADETHFAPFADGLTAVLARYGTSSDLKLATRSSALDEWGPFTNIATLSTSADEWDPWPSSDGRRIVLTVSALPGGPGGKDLALAARTTLDAPFGTPIPLDVDTAGDESGPTLSADERFLVFVRETASDGGDLFFAERATRDGAFGQAVRLPSVNTNDIEAEPALAPAACELYFSREVAGTGFDIFRARFVPQ